jgi:dienelactone hydrolase
MHYCRGLVLLLGLLIGAFAAVRADTVTIPASGQTPAITGYMARPSGAGPFPAVLILHGCNGYEQFYSNEADELAGLGYIALAIDALKPQGLRTACGNAAGARTATQYAAAALAWLHTQPYVKGNRLGVLGFSMGGIEILNLIDPESPAPPPAGLRVAVAYYPSCTHPSANLTVPLQIFDGDADDWTPAPPCQALAQAAPGAGKTVLITTYPGVTHDFADTTPHPSHYMGHALIYDPSAAADADAKMRAFLAHYLK